MFTALRAGALSNVVLHAGKRRPATAKLARRQLSTIGAADGRFPRKGERFLFMHYLE